MPKPYASTVLPASADRAWEYLRDFAGISEWHPGIVSAGPTAMTCWRARFPSGRTVLRCTWCR
jgi:hypothetical protein